MISDPTLRGLSHSGTHVGWLCDDTAMLEAEAPHPGRTVRGAFFCPVLACRVCPLRLARSPEGAHLAERRFGRRMKGPSGLRGTAHVRLRPAPPSHACPTHPPPARARERVASPPPPRDGAGARGLRTLAVPGDGRARCRRAALTRLRAGLRIPCAAFPPMRAAFLVGSPRRWRPSSRVQRMHAGVMRRRAGSPPPHTRVVRTHRMISVHTSRMRTLA